jgi:hypothetical protein
VTFSSAALRADPAVECLRRSAGTPLRSEHLGFVDPGGRCDRIGAGVRDWGKLGLHRSAVHHAQAGQSVNVSYGIWVSGGQIDASFRVKISYDVLFSVGADGRLHTTKAKPCDQ